MCLSRRTIHTVCAHFKDETLTDCRKSSLAKKLRLSAPDKCRGVRTDDAFIKLGWCRDCERALKRAQKTHDHPRRILPTDRHVMKKYWNWRKDQADGCLQPVPASGMPIGLIDGAEEMEHKRRRDEDITDEWLAQAHAWLRRKAPLLWAQADGPSIFYTYREHNGTYHYLPPKAVPRLECWKDEDGHRYVAFEAYAILFALYQCQPNKVWYPHKKGPAGVPVAATNFHAMELLVHEALVDTIIIYGEDTGRDWWAIRKQDRERNGSPKYETLQEAMTREYVHPWDRTYDARGRCDPRQRC